LEKVGRSPVPDGSLVISIGLPCLKLAMACGVLFNATEPARNPAVDHHDSCRTECFHRKSDRGTLIFAWRIWKLFPIFAPESHKGHKMQAKGYLTRQPGAERISLSSMEMLDAICGPASESVPKPPLTNFWTNFLLSITVQGGRYLFKV